jgi:hypothetical protein
MNKYTALLHSALVTLVILTALPAMAANDADTDTSTQSILRGHVEPLNLSVPKEERNYVEESTPNIASSNIVNGRQPSQINNDCSEPWSPLSKAALASVAMIMSNYYGGSTKTTDSALPCRNMSMVKKN